MRCLASPAWAALAWCALATGEAGAHQASNSYLSVRVDQDPITARWDIALRDLEYAIGLDADLDGAVTWGEVRARHRDIAAYGLARLTLSVEGVPCTARPLRQLVDEHADGGYAVLYIEFQCSARGPTVALDYRLFFDLDPLHRGLVQVQATDGVRSAVLAPGEALLHVDLRQAGTWDQFVEYGREGVWHVWIGYDHVLFLLALVLPAVLRGRGVEPRHAERFVPVFLDVLAIVTAFTLAHSLTLGVAVLGGVSLPARPVESAIAATVMLGALNNLFPVVTTRRWVMAFVLGLIHGLGFAAVLTDLGLPAQSLAVALAGFNLGVECGQLAIVAAFLPLAYGLRATWFYQRAVVEFGSLAVAGIGLVWLVQRGLNVHT